MPFNTTLKPRAVITHGRTSSDRLVHLGKLLWSREDRPWQGHHVAEPAGLEGEATSLVNRLLGSEFLCLRQRVTTLTSPPAEKNTGRRVAPTEVTSRRTRGPREGPEAPPEEHGRDTLGVDMRGRAMTGGGMSGATGATL